MDDAFKLQKVFQTLGDSNRLKIIRYVGRDARSVSEIVQATELSQPLVSHHLKVLRDIGILQSERKGPFVYHSIKDERLVDSLGLFLDIFSDYSGEGVQEPMFCVPPRWKSHWYKES